MSPSTQLFILLWVKKSQVTFFLHIYILHFHCKSFFLFLSLILLIFLLIPGISKHLMPKCKMDAEDRGYYHCPYSECDTSCSARVNTCTHIRRDHLQMVLQGSICDHPVFSTMAYKNHFKAEHPTLLSTLGQASNVDELKETFKRP